MTKLILGDCLEKLKDLPDNSVDSVVCKTRFKKGNIPWNKNKKGIHLSIKSEFKKGQIGINHKDVGSITKRKDKNGVIRAWIKILEPNKWIELYRYNWIKAGRLFTKNQVIHHIDFNSENDDIANLVSLSRAEHINVHRTPNPEYFKIAKARIENVNITLL